VATSTLGSGSRLFAQWWCLLCAAASIFGVANAADRGGPACIVLTPANTPQACFEVRGLPSGVAAQLRKLSPSDPRWLEIFNVRVASATPGKQPAMLGSYGSTQEGVQFRPRFPLEPAIKYQAVFEWPVSGSPSQSIASQVGHIRLAETFVISRSRTGPPAQVVAIYPSGHEIPENLLRLYIQFSGPMSQGDCYARIHLRDETRGTEVPRPFLELPQELWSPDGTRLTLLLEPGRVKHDLAPREEAGPILVAGRTYSLAIDATWPDAEGRPLTSGIRKTFRAAKAEPNRLDPSLWRIDAPHSGTRDLLVVHFPKPLDRAMLERVLRVLRVDGVEVDGTIHVAEAETRWTFEPQEPWSTGRYRLLASTRLEDPCGNSIGRAFEVDLKRSPALPPAPATVQMEFEVRDRR